MTASRHLELESAIKVLLRGYEEELNLYFVVRALAMRQKEMLREPSDLLSFCDLLDEKEDLLQIIGQMEYEMEGAKSFVLSSQPGTCPYLSRASRPNGRWRLTVLLDRVTAAIEDIRAIEQDNISLLQSMPD